MNSPKTKFYKRNPFTGEPLVKTRYVPAEKLTIASDPLPEGKAKITNKYHDVFSKLKHGQCVICEPDDVQRVAKALRGWMTDEKVKGQIRSTKLYEKDGKGRVWMMPL